MKQKQKTVPYKLYLTAQSCIAVLGIASLLWIFISSIHDIPLSQKAKACTEKVLGSTIDDHIEYSSWVEQVQHYHRDTFSAKQYHNKPKFNPNAPYTVPSEMSDLELKLRYHCSEYLSVSSFSSNLYISVNTWLGVSPASVFQRFKYSGWIVGLTLTLMILLFSIMKWCSWIVRNDSEGN